MPPRIRQGRFADTTSRGRPPLSVDRLAATTGSMGRPRTRRIRRTTRKGPNRMTPLSQRGSSERVAPHRSEPAAARASIWLSQHAVSGIDSLRPDSPMFHTGKGTGNLTAKVSLTRSEHQGIASDKASIRLTHLVSPGECRKGAPVTIFPAAAPDPSMISCLTSLGQHGRGVTTRCGSAPWNLACRGHSDGPRSPPRMTVRNASSSSR